MTRTRRTGVTVEVRLAELEANLELMGDELARLERRYDLEHEALVRIASAESGSWGWIAHEALEAARAA